ncbi:MAG: DUF3427 domain-containing protein, partial [Sphingobacteriales bacterium]
MQIINYLRDSVSTGFVDAKHQSHEIYRPQFLTNDKALGKKVLSSIVREIRDCESFWISVAFVTTSGVASIIASLEEFKENGRSGRILVSDYLAFTQPDALKRLMQFENIELKMSQNRSFHAKGYLFKHGEIYNLVVGSSNLTGSALSVNTEWNLKVSASIDSQIITNAVLEFTREFELATAVDYA